METAAYFREKAERCRRLAAGIPTRNDPAKEALLALAREFDLQAAAMEARSATAHHTAARKS
jgi:hypothetical protein